MSTIVTRAGKGSALTHTEVDANFTNLNTDKIEAAQSVTLTNKTIALGSNTVSGTTAQFNTALTDGDFATLAGSETLTNKTISGSSNTLSNISNASLTNSSVTIGSTSVSLGSTATTVSGLTLSSPTISGGTVNNASVGATTPSTGAFTTLSATGVTTVQAGTAAAPAITTSGDTNTGVFFPAADTVAIGTGGTERLRVDSAGNAGLGVTPSASETGFGLQVGTTASNSYAYSKRGMITNGYYDTTWRYYANGGAAIYQPVGSVHAWYNAPSGTAGNAITFTQAMTLDASGNLMVGGTTARGMLTIGGNSTRYFTVGDTGVATLRFDDNGTPAFNLLNYGITGANQGYQLRWQLADAAANFAVAGSIAVQTDQAWTSASSTQDAYMQFAVALNGTNTERARITSGGDYGINTGSSVNAKLDVVQDSASSNGGRVAYFRSTASGDVANNAVIISKYDNNTTTSQIFMKFEVNNTATSCGRINANGANTAAFGSTSDRRIKENIEDLPSQLQNILALRPVEFDYIESYGGGHQIGFIAQEMQEVYPDVVSADESEEQILSITGWSKTEARLVKAIQELNAKVEALEAQLKGKA